MTKMEYFMMGIPKDSLERIRQKYPETLKRGGLQDYIRGLIGEDLNKLSHEEYMGKIRKLSLE